MPKDAAPRPAGADRHVVVGAFAVASLVAIAFGALSMTRSEVAPSRWIMNLAGWGLSGLIALGIAHLR